jgi:hypothetical protein
VAATTIAITSRRVIAKVLSLPTNLREDGKNLWESAQELGDALTINATFLDERHHLKKSRGRKTSSVARRDVKGRSASAFAGGPREASLVPEADRLGRRLPRRCD